MISKTLGLFTLLLFIGKLQSFGQDKVGIGFGGSRNMALKSFAPAVRIQLPITQKLMLNPSFSYANALIQDINVGLQMQYFFRPITESYGYKRYKTNPKRFASYALGSITYNKWVNYFPSNSKVARKNNILPIVGLGTTIGGYSVRFYGEVKYNALFSESYFDFGVLLYPGFMNSARRVKCPGYK
ncbi:MAG: hypothetical protein ACRCVT_06155 [Leadbetterella sp.]